MTTFGSSLVFIFNPEYHSINLFFGIFLFLCVYEALKEKNSLSSFVLIGFILWLCNSFLYPSFISQMNDEFVKKWYELFTLLVPGLMLSTWIHYLKIYQEPPVILFLLGLKTALFFILYRNHTISHHDSFYLIFNDLIKSSISAIGFFYSFRISHLKELLIIQATMLCPFLDGLAKNATIIQPILSIVTIPWIACICFFFDHTHQSHHPQNRSFSPLVQYTSIINRSPFSHNLLQHGFTADTGSSELKRKIEPSIDCGSTSDLHDSLQQYSVSCISIPHQTLYHHQSWKKQKLFFRNSNLF